MYTVVRAALLGTFCAVIALDPSLSHASIHRIKMDKQAARYSKYFNNAHRVTLNGGAKPYVRTATLGWQAKFLLGGRGGIGLATVVEKGMERSMIYGSVGASLGAQVGFGPEFKQTYFFGRRGHRAREIVPTLTVKQGLSLLVAGWEIPGGEQRFGSRSFEPSVGVKFLGVDVAVLPPFAKRATKSAYLKRLEAGQRLSKKAVQHLSDGQYTQARNVIDRLKIIYKKNVKERQMINGYKSEHMKDRNY